jgi:hypothetical protein
MLKIQAGFYRQVNKLNDHQIVTPAWCSDHFDDRMNNVFGPLRTRSNGGKAELRSAREFHRELFRRTSNSRLLLISLLHFSDHVAARGGTRDLIPQITPALVVGLQVHVRLVNHIETVARTRGFAENPTYRTFISGLRPTGMLSGLTTW